MYSTIIVGRVQVHFIHLSIEFNIWPLRKVKFPHNFLVTFHLVQMAQSSRSWKLFKSVIDYKFYTTVNETHNTTAKTKWTTCYNKLKYIVFVISKCRISITHTIRCQFLFVGTTIELSKFLSYHQKNELNNCPSTESKLNNFSSTNFIFSHFAELYRKHTTHLTIIKVTNIVDTAYWSDIAAATKFRSFL